MKFRNIVYVVVTILCILAIGAAVYYQIFGMDKNTNVNNNQTSNNNSNLDDQNIDLEKIKNNFNNLFTNELKTQGYEISEEIKKINENKDIIYKAYEIKKQEENKYSVNINLPVFNISNETVDGFNKITQNVFANKANEILIGNIEEDVYTIYNIDYIAYLNDNILSLVIKSTLKEGTNAQRVIVQTYNYDVKTGKSLTLADVLEEKQIEKQDVNKKIEKQVTYAYNKAEAVSAATSQTVYKRDLNSAIYLVDNVRNFFLGEDGKIYIVYAYGNYNFTSEIDIVEL